MRSNAPSRIAALIAAATLRHARDRRLAARLPELFPDPASRVFPGPVAGLSAAFLRAGGFPLLRLLAVPGAGALATLLERFTVPGLGRHFLARKAFIAARAGETLDEGFERLTVIGAGFDTLALRLAARGAGAPRARFAEIDHPATQAVKLTALQAKPLAWHAVGADLTRVPLADALREAWPEEADPALAPPMLFIAEGVLMYLERAAVESLFAALRPWGRRQRVIFSFMEPDAKGRIAFHNATPLVRGVLSAWREPFAWGVSRQALPGFLAPLGYRVETLAPGAELAAAAGLPAPYAAGETLCVAARIDVR